MKITDITKTPLTIGKGLLRVQTDAGIEGWSEVPGRNNAVFNAYLESVIKPVLVGDVVSCYADIQKVGTTSITIGIEAWALRRHAPQDRSKVTEGVFTFVALDEKGDKRTVPPALNI